MFGLRFASTLRATSTASSTMTSAAWRRSNTRNGGLSGYGSRKNAFAAIAPIQRRC